MNVPEGPVEVWRLALLERELGARSRADGPVEAVPHAPVHVARVELLERVIQRRVTLRAHHWFSHRKLNNPMHGIYNFEN